MVVVIRRWSLAQVWLFLFCRSSLYLCFFLSAISQIWKWISLWCITFLYFQCLSPYMEICYMHNYFFWPFFDVSKYPFSGVPVFFVLIVQWFLWFWSVIFSISKNFIMLTQHVNIYSLNVQHEYFELDLK
jgi:hypothetical protein